jgi:glycosyltransferase involved in cell wall biosynthesis
VIPVSLGRRTTAVGVVIPIHNEEELLGRALSALDVALGAVPATIDHRVALVLDSCSDTSQDIARRWAAENSALLVYCEETNVGAARRAGCAALLEWWRLRPRHQVWLATTDADSRVPRQWLSAQVAAREAGADLWTGRVAVKDWSHGQAGTAERWTALYAREIAPIHGTSMGISAQLYVDIGGFAPLATGEDRDIYSRAISSGAVPHHDSTVDVVTSSRSTARAPLGFAHALANI